jgi:ATP-independent RNA helicase DbpA
LNQPAFSTLDLSSDLMQSLSLLAYESMTPIQALSLPHILNGKDVVAQAKTGSGKTAAFGIGILSRLDVKANHVQGLVLCPTRELADQVAKEIRKLARVTPNIRVLTLCGGIPFSAQTSSLKRSVHIVVGTPGRIEEHLQKKTLKLNQLDILVLDEADRMLDMGFQPSLDAITAQIQKKRQTLLFSATYPEKIHLITERVMTDPIKVEVDTTHDDTNIQQHFYKVKDDGQRMTALRLLLLQHCPESTLVFCNTKRETDSVAEQLQGDGFSALALHGDLEQKERREILVQFANKSISVLVATDVAARGLDINKIDAIINYHIARDLEVHVHRIGRTGRAGSIGKAYSLYADNEYCQIKLLEDYLDQPIKADTLPPLSLLKKSVHHSSMATLQINGGKSQKVRPGDIVGALTGEHGVKGTDIGDIHIFDRRAYVAVSKKVIHIALKKLSNGKLKGRSFRVWRV